MSAFQAQMGRKVSGQKDVRGPRQGNKGRRDESREKVKGERSEPASKDSMEAAALLFSGAWPRTWVPCTQRLLPDVTPAQLAGSCEPPDYP